MKKWTFFPPMAIIGIYSFLYLPMIVLLVFSFNKEPLPAPWNGFTWHWYRELFYNSPQLWRCFGNSLLVAIFSTIFSLLLGLSAVFYCFCHKKRSMQGGLAIFIAATLIPEIVFAVSLTQFFDFLDISLGLPTLIVGHTVLGVGFVVPLMVARFFELDHKMLEASLVLGATPRQTFRYLVIPSLAMPLWTTAILVFVLSFDDFALSYFCASATSQTLSLYLLSMLRTGVSPVANALSALLLIFSSSLVAVLFWFNRRVHIF